MNVKDEYLITELGKMLGVPTATIRYYNNIGIFSHIRKENNYRAFDTDSITNAYAALLMRKADIPLDVVRDFVQSEDIPTAVSNCLTIGQERLTVAQEQLDKQWNHLIGLSALLKNCKDEANIIKRKDSPTWYGQPLQQSYSLATAFGIFSKIESDCGGIPCFSYSIELASLRNEDMPVYSHVKDYIVSETIPRKHLADYSVIESRPCMHMLYVGTMERVRQACIRLVDAIKENGYELQGDIIRERYLISNNSGLAVELWAPIQTDSAK